MAVLDSKGNGLKMWLKHLSSPHTHTHLLGQFTVLIDVSNLLAAEVSGGLRTGTAVHWSFRIAAVVVAVACGGLTLIHGVVLGRPLQRWETLCSPAEQHTHTHTEISHNLEAG